MPSIPQMLLAAIAAVMALSTATVAQSPAFCGYAGFDFTSLMNGPDLLLSYSNVNGDSWAVHPCGQVTTSGFCSGSFCQEGTTVATFNATAVGNAASDYQSFGVTNEPIWTLVTRSNQYGIAQIIQDGATCGGYGSRQGTMEFMCNPAATTPYLSSVIESVTCHYIATIQTSAACSVSFASALAAGVPLQSTQCGGGLMNLTALNVDIVDTTSGTIIHPCGNIVNATAPYCYAGGSSVCQTTTGGTSTQFATYNPFGFPTMYQMTANGINQIIQDGATCPNSNTERLVNISYVCDATATTPKLTVVNSTAAACHFQYTIASAALCGQTMTTPTAVFPAANGCKFGPYDLTSISNQTLTVGTNSSGQYYIWAVKPCGLITDLGYCAGQFCQHNTVINYWSADPTMYQALSGSVSTPLWAAVTYQGQSGVAQIIQDGQSCGGNVGARQGAVYYLCNQTATTPFLVSVVESPACHYTAVVQTSAVCGVSTTALQQPGVSTISATCGGGIYNLASLSADITGYQLNGNNWTVNLCGPETSIVTGGCNMTAACQWGGNSISASSFSNGLSTYSPNTYPTIYTYNGNGLSQIIQDGPANCGNTNTERYTNITLVCSPTATTPVMTAVTEPVECHYSFTIMTSAVCGSPLFVAAPGGGGSSGTSGAGSSAASAASAASAMSSAASAASAASAMSSMSSAASAMSAASAASSSAASAASAMSAMSSSAASAASAAPAASSSSAGSAARSSSTAAAGAVASSSSAPAMMASSSPASTAAASQPSSPSTAAVAPATAATSATTTTTPVPSSTATVVIPPAGSSSVASVVVASSTAAPGPSKISGASNVQFAHAALVLVSTLAVAALLL